MKYKSELLYVIHYLSALLAVGTLSAILVLTFFDDWEDIKFISYFFIPSFTIYLITYYLSGDLKLDVMLESASWIFNYVVKVMGSLSLISAFYYFYIDKIEAFEYKLLLFIICALLYPLSHYLSKKYPYKENN